MTMAVREITEMTVEEVLTESNFTRLWSVVCRSGEHPTVNNLALDDII